MEEWVLVERLEAHLQGLGYETLREVPIAWRIADIVATRGDLLEAFEVKVNDWRGALLQARAYELGAHRSWVVLPYSKAQRISLRKEILEATTGLLGVDDEGRVVNVRKAKDSPRRLPFLTEKILEEFSSHDSWSAWRALRNL